MTFVSYLAAKNCALYCANEVRSPYVYSMAVNFNAGASSAELDMGADSGEAARARSNQLRWDRKRKKMVHVDPVSNMTPLIR